MMMQTKQALNGHNISEEDPNSFGSTGHFNAQYSSEPNHYSAENETYEDVEEREYEENEEEQRGDYHQEQGNTEQYQDNQGEEHEEIEGQDETNSGTVRGERNNRNIASRESKKRGGDNPLSQVKENPEENNNDEEGEEGLMSELKALAGSTSNKSKQLKSQGEKSQWDPRYFNDRFNFEQLGGKSFNAKVTPTKFHKHYDKFCKEFLDKKEEGLQQKRREKQDAEVAGLQEKPKLISKGQTKPYVPLLDRTPIMDARREKELEKIKQEKEEKLLRELEELTFAPKINPKSKKLSSPSREKIMKMYLQTRFNHSPISARNGERSHTPKINSRSRNIADTTREHASRDVVDRLYIDADVGKTKKDRLAQQLTPSFSPKLNRNTRKIAKQIERNYNTYDDRNSRFETEGNYSRDTEKYSSQKRMATEGDTQNLSDLDQSTDYELLQILKQFNEMLKQKNENPITLDQLSALMSSYSQKKRANSSQRNDDQNATEQDEDNVIYEENDSQRPPNTDRPLRSNLNEQSSESFENQNKSLRVQTNTPNSSRQKETPKKSSNFMSPRSQAGAQSPVRSQSPISSPTKKSGALMSHLIQNPRCKNKNDDRPTTSINQAIMQKALKGSPLKGGKISPTTQKLDKSQNKEVSLDKSNTFEKATQTSKKSKQSEQAQEDQIDQNVVEDLGLANQDQNEIVHEYVLNNHEEEKHKKSAIPYGRDDLDEYNNEYHSHKDHSENILNQEGSHHAADEHHKQEGQDVQNQNNSYSRKGDSKNPSYSKIAEKSKVATSKQSIRGSNKSSLNSLNHHEEQGYTSKYKGKSIYSTQKGGQSKNGLSQKESVNQVEEERASEKEQVQPDLNESQQKAEEHSFSANTIENHNSSFDDNQANQAEQRTLEELVSASKASSIRQYEAEPPKRTSPRKPQIQFEVITTETIQIQPSSTKKTNFTFSMDGGDKAFPTASGTGLKQMAQQIVKKFRAYDNQIKQSSREYRVSVSPAKTNSPSPDSRDNSESKASKNEPKVFKSVVEKGASSKSSKKAKASLQGSLSSVHSGRESFLAKKGAVGGVGTPRRSDF